MDRKLSVETGGRGRIDRNEGNQCETNVLSQIDLIPFSWHCCSYFAGAYIEPVCKRKSDFQSWGGERAGYPQQTITSTCPRERDAYIYIYIYIHVCVFCCVYAQGLVGVMVLEDDILHVESLEARQGRKGFVRVAGSLPIKSSLMKILHSSSSGVDVTINQMEVG